MKKLSYTPTKLSFLTHAVLVFAALLYLPQAYSAVTPAKAKEIVNKNGIPQWIEATEQVRAFRAKPTERAKALWDALDGETDVGTGKAPLAQATTPVDATDMFLKATWLRWRVLSENADGRYSYAYAANLIRMTGPGGRDFSKEAAGFYYHGRLALEIDADRCVDKDSGRSIIHQYETQKMMQELAEKIAKMMSRDRAIAMLEAVSMEEARGERPTAKWLCNRGALAMTDAMRQGRNFEAIATTESSVNARIGKIYQIDVSDVEPKLLAIEEWRAKRRERLDRMIEAAAALF